MRNRGRNESLTKQVRFSRSLDPEERHVSGALPQCGSVVPEVDPTDAALASIAQVNDAAFAAARNEERERDVVRGTVLVCDHHVVHLERCVSDLEFETAEVVERPCDDDAV